MSGLDWREAGDRCAQWERWLRGTPNSGCGQHSGVSTGLLSGPGGTDAVVTVSVRHDIVASIGHACWRKLSQQAQQTPQKAVLQSAAEGRSPGAGSGGGSSGPHLSALGKQQKMDRGLEGGHVDRGSERRHRVWADDPPSPKAMGGQGCVG